MFRTIYLRLRWTRYENVMKNYEDYITLECGIKEVKTQNIIGLSLWPPEKVYRDEKMERLKNSVKVKGWNDPFPGDLHLYRVPNKKYTVCSGGNHRPILADIINLHFIEAYVTLVIPKKLIKAKTDYEIIKLTDQINEIENKAKKLNNYLNTKGVYRSDYKKDEKKLDKMYLNIKELRNKTDTILKHVALDNNLVEENYFHKI